MKTELILAARYIFEMRQYGMDEEAALEALEGEFRVPTGELKEIADKYRVMAKEWYEIGDAKVCALIASWLLEEHL